MEDRIVFVKPREFNVFKQDFDALDTNGSGRLEAPEVSQLLKNQLQRDPTADELDNYFARNDRDGNGSMSLHEYVASLVGGPWQEAEPPPPLTLAISIRKHSYPAGQIESWHMELAAGVCQLAVARRDGAAGGTMGALLAALEVDLCQEHEAPLPGVLLTQVIAMLKDAGLTNGVEYDEQRALPEHVQEGCFVVLTAEGKFAGSAQPFKLKLCGLLPDSDGAVHGKERKWLTNSATDAFIMGFPDQWADGQQVALDRLTQVGDAASRMIEPLEHPVLQTSVAAAVACTDSIVDVWGGMVSWASEATSDLLGADRSTRYSDAIGGLYNDVSGWTSQNASRVCGSVSAGTQAAVDGAKELLLRGATQGAFTNITNRKALSERQREMTDLQDQLKLRHDAKEQELQVELQITHNQMLELDQEKHRLEGVSKAQKQMNQDQVVQQKLEQHKQTAAQQQQVVRYEQSGHKARLAQKLARRKLRRLEEDRMIAQAEQVSSLQTLVLRQALEDEVLLAQAGAETRVLEAENQQDAAERASLEEQLRAAGEEREAADVLAAGARGALKLEGEAAEAQSKQREALEVKIAERSQRRAQERKALAEVERNKVLMEFERLGACGQPLSDQGTRLLKSVETVIELMNDQIKVNF